MIARYSLPGRSPASFEMFDVQGRRIARHVVTPEHAGDAETALPLRGSVRAGIYFVRLTQNRESRTQRFVLVR
jgi:hypothetical protein